jgi:long-chain acyl-CoA synthetase
VSSTDPRTPVATSLDDPAFLTYTSGTTGPPKGAINALLNDATLSMTGRFGAVRGAGRVLRARRDDDRRVDHRL